MYVFTKICSFVLTYVLLRLSNTLLHFHWLSKADTIVSINKIHHSNWPYPRHSFIRFVHYTFSAFTMFSTTRNETSDVCWSNNCINFKTFCSYVNDASMHKSVLVFSYIFYAILFCGRMHMKKSFQCSLYAYIYTSHHLNCQRDLFDSFQHDAIE